jgi:hypothetical protein
MAISKGPKKKVRKICPIPPKILVILKNNSVKCGKCFWKFSKKKTSSLDHVSLEFFFIKKIINIAN